MRRIVCALLLLGLAGCGVWSSTIRSELVDYTDVLDSTANQLLLVNILEARDDAPLHFAAIPNIHGSLQATATLTNTFPFEQGHEGQVIAGTTATSTVPATTPTPAPAFLNTSIVPAISVQSSPTFEVDSVETKDFVTGLSTPIDPKFIKYWVDRGLDKRLILLLFFSSAEIVDARTNSAIVVRNDPRRAAEEIALCRRQEQAEAESQCHARSGFELYLKFLNSFAAPISANVYAQRMVVIDDKSLDLKDALSFDPTKYQLERQKDGNVSLFTLPGPQSYALCLGNDLDLLTGWNGALEPDRVPELVVLRDKRGRIVKNRRGRPIKVETLVSTKHENICSDALITRRTAQAGFTLPSPGQVLNIEPPTGYREYLDQPCSGDPRTSRGPNEQYCSLLLGFVSDTSHRQQYRVLLTLRSVAEVIRYLGDILYYQDTLGSSDEHHNIPVTLWYEGGAGSDVLFDVREGDENGRVEVSYRHHRYFIPEHRDSDHSLEVLSVVNQLVNLNKSASDLKTTQSVYIIP